MTVAEKAAEIERLQRYIAKREGQQGYAANLKACREALAPAEAIEAE